MYNCSRSAYGLGVTCDLKRKGKQFRARLFHQGVIDLGRFCTPHEACLAYDQAARAVSGDGSLRATNYPPGMYTHHFQEVDDRVSRHLAALGGSSASSSSPETAGHEQGLCEPQPAAAASDHSDGTGMAPWQDCGLPPAACPTSMCAATALAAAQQCAAAAVTQLEHTTEVQLPQQGVHAAAASGAALLLLPGQWPADWQWQPSDTGTPAAADFVGSAAPVTAHLQPASGEATAATEAPDYMQQQLVQLQADFTPDSPGFSAMLHGLFPEECGLAQQQQQQQQQQHNGSRENSSAGTAVGAGGDPHASQLQLPWGDAYASQLQLQPLELMSCAVTPPAGGGGDGRLGDPEATPRVQQQQQTHFAGAGSPVPAAANWTDDLHQQQQQHRSSCGSVTTAANSTQLLLSATHPSPACAAAAEVAAPAAVGGCGGPACRPHEQQQQPQQPCCRAVQPSHKPTLATAGQVVDFVDTTVGHLLQLYTRLTTHSQQHVGLLAIAWMAAVRSSATTNSSSSQEPPTPAAAAVQVAVVHTCAALVTLCAGSGSAGADGGSGQCGASSPFSCSFLVCVLEQLMQVLMFVRAVCDEAEPSQAVDCSRALQAWRQELQAQAGNNTGQAVADLLSWL